MSKLKAATILTIFCELGAAACIDRNLQLKDLLAINLTESSSCPQNITELKALMKKDGIEFKPTMVANRGIHNQGSGSFSIFEMSSGYSKELDLLVASGHLYVGHFTRLNSQGIIELSQDNRHGGLLIEAIAFDFKKKVYNFYELIGERTGPRWFYRGDSYDIFRDNQNLKMGANSSFGKRMRCSACHNSGGPIMKELASPHNDWWREERPLLGGRLILSDELKKYTEDFVDASEFALGVRQGIELLEEGPIYKSLSIKEKLRPLFCTTEVNLISDLAPLESPLQDLRISSESFISPWLVEKYYMRMDKNLYINGLNGLGAYFPESNRIDADYGFLIPVKAESNHLYIKKLIDDGIVDEEFVVDILAYDFTKPMFSSKRCALMKFIDNSLNWKMKLVQKLKNSSKLELKQLGESLVSLDRAILILRAKEFLKNKELSWKDKGNVQEELLRLQQVRHSVYAETISSNPLGQILEPGFRIIFPEFSNRPKNLVQRNGSKQELE